MYNLSQKELLNEGLWDAFKKGAHSFGNTVNSIKNAGAAIGEIVAPETSSKLKSIKNKWRGAFKNIEQAFTSIEERILDWMDEQGYVPIPDGKIKLGKNTPKGQHYIVKLAEKGVNKQGETVPGKKYRYPQAIILFDKYKNDFQWVIRPRRDVFIRSGPNNDIEYWDRSALD